MEYKTKVTSYSKSNFPPDFIGVLSSPTFYQSQITNSSVLGQSSLGSDWFDIITSPNYAGGLKIEMVIATIKFSGIYKLGDRYTPGGCIDFSIINQKTIDDEC